MPALMRYMTTLQIGDWKIVLVNRMIVLMTFVFPFSEWWAKRILIAALVLFLFAFSKERFLYAIRQKTVLALLAFVLLVGISWFYTETDLGTTLHYFKRFFTYLILPLVLVASALHPSYIKYVIGAFLASMFVNEIVSYGILFGWWLELSVRGFPTPFMMHSTYSAVIAFTVMLMVYEIIHERNRLKMALYLLFTMLMLGNLVISGGRTGQITLLMSLFSLVVFYKHRDLKSIAVLIIMPILLFAITYHLYTPFQDRVNRIVYEAESSVENDYYGSSVGNRIGMYIVASDIMKDNTPFQWVFGHGAGELKWVKNRTIDKYYPKAFRASRHYHQFHNIYIDVYVGMGLVGLILLIMFMWSFMRETIDDREINFIKIALSLTMIYSFLPHHTLYEKEFMLLMAIFIGIVLVQKKYESKSDDA